MPTRDQMTSFPPNAKSNPGRRDDQQPKHKEKFINNPSRGPLKSKSRSKRKS